MPEEAVGQKGKLYRDGSPVTDCDVLDYQAGRLNGDHLLQFPNGGDGTTGLVTREWYVIRPHGTSENGTFELNP